MKEKNTFYRILPATFVFIQRWIAVIGMASGFVVGILSDGRHSRWLWSAGALCCTARFLWTELLMEPDSQQLMANDVLKSKCAVRNSTLSGQMCKASYIQNYFIWHLEALSLNSLILKMRCIKFICFYVLLAVHEKLWN